MHKFEEMCKALDYWPYSEKNEKYARIFTDFTLPSVAKETLKKFNREIEESKEQMLFKMEQEKLCPLLPLCVFPLMG